jgi:putative FmdB family regulatory protein
MAHYNYICKKCNEIKLDLKLGTAKEIETCPICGQEIKRDYSPIGNIWKCSGNYNSTR